MTIHSKAISKYLFLNNLKIQNSEFKAMSFNTNQPIIKLQNKLGDPILTSYSDELHRIFKFASHRKLIKEHREKINNKKLNLK